MKNRSKRNALIVLGILLVVSSGLSPISVSAPRHSYYEVHIAIADAEAYRTKVAEARALSPTELARRATVVNETHSGNWFLPLYKSFTSTFDIGLREPGAVVRIQLLFMNKTFRGAPPVVLTRYVVKSNVLGACSPSGAREDARELALEVFAKNWGKAE